MSLASDERPIEIGQSLNPLDGHRSDLRNHLGFFIFKMMPGAETVTTGLWADVMRKINKYFCCEIALTLSESLFYFYHVWKRMIFIRNRGNVIKVCSELIENLFNNLEPRKLKIHREVREYSERGSFSSFSVSNDIFLS